MHLIRWATRDCELAGGNGLKFPVISSSSTPPLGVRNGLLTPSVKPDRIQQSGVFRVRVGDYGHLAATSRRYSHTDRHTAASSQAGRLGSCLWSIILSHRDRSAMRPMH
jgi:hypothetical protein